MTYKIENGFIVYPWSDEREELGEYILRCEREVADELVTTIHHLSVDIKERFKRNRLGISNPFLMGKFMREQRKIIYYHAVMTRIMNGHEELEEWMMDR